MLVVGWPPDKCAGYGRFHLTAGLFVTHRIAYYLTYGEPGPYLVLHKCNTPLCCNPNHLFLGDQFDNMQQKVREGRMNYIGQANGQALFYNSDIIKIRERSKNGETNASIARSLNTSGTVISDILNGKSYRDA